MYTLIVSGKLQNEILLFNKSNTESKNVLLNMLSSGKVKITWMFDVPQEKSPNVQSYYTLSFLGHLNAEEEGAVIKKIREVSGVEGLYKAPSADIP